MSKHKNLVEVDKSHLVKIKGKLYVPECARKRLVKKNLFVPVYFAVVNTGDILHDTPVMGCMSIGNTQRRIYGPFLSLKEAENVKKEKQKIDSIHHEASGGIETILIPEKVFPESGQVQIYRYNRTTHKVSASFSDARQYDKAAMAIKQLSEIVFKQIRKTSQQRLEKEGEITAFVNNCFFNSGFRKGFGNTFFYTDVFRQEAHSADYIHIPVAVMPYDLLSKAGVKSFDIIHRNHFAEYVSLSPVKISLNYGSMENIIKEMAL